MTVQRTMNRFDQHREYPAACLYAVGLSAYVSRILLLSLSTVADAKISNPPWVNFQSAGWVIFQSAPTAEAQLRIFSVEDGGQIFYPSYAFLTDGHGSLIPDLLDVLTVLHSERSGWDMAFWFRSPNTFLGGKRPEDVLGQNLHDLLFAAHEEVCSVTPG